jgi:hypothetical protein
MLIGSTRSLRSLRALNRMPIFRYRPARENDISRVLWFLICHFKNPLFENWSYEGRIIRYIDQNEELITIKLKAVIRHRPVPRVGAGGHNQPPQGTLAGFWGRCYNSCPDGSVTESLFLSSSPSVGDRAASDWGSRKGGVRDDYCHVIEYLT